MGTNRFSQLDLKKIPSPSFLVDEGLIEENLRILDSVQKKTGCKIFLALKGYAMWSTFPIVKKYLAGVCASSVNEAKLGHKDFGKEIHAYAPAYSKEDIKNLVKYCTAISFNSFSQWKSYKGFFMRKKIKCGLRVNPEYSEIKTELYNPCLKNSRLGVLESEMKGEDLTGLSGLHFHALCEQQAVTLEKVLAAFKKRFGKYLNGMSWVNFGGGHHITHPSYNREKLCELIIDFREKYNVDVYLEPGTSVALNAGILVAAVLDIVHGNVVILDTSAEAHMPDVLAMPYRPEIINAGLPKEKKHTYIIGGITCLAGDIIGEYSFDNPLKIGDKIVFLDMAHYSMVKTTMFNGIQHPSIGIIKKNGEVKILRRFGYEDYRDRLS